VKILITGSAGLVGKRTVELALARGFECIAQVRIANRASVIPTVALMIGADTDWKEALNGVDVVIHCAARVHQMNEESPVNADQAYQEVNVNGTLNLARQAVSAGVKRFIFLSSIKVNGEFSLPNRPFTPEISSVPQDLYGRSKYEAELGLQAIAKETELEVVIIRPPLVYGPRVRANFASMMKWVHRGIPLPFGAVDNQRSLVYLDNLVDLMLTCCTHPQAKDQILFVSDDCDLSTTELLRSVAQAMQVPNRLIPIPSAWISTALRMVGKQALGQRLFGSLQVDISQTKERLDWQPPVSFGDAIKATVAAYQTELTRDKND
jgi:nucleoside-diphosphate-sugar epimerase